MIASLRQRIDELEQLEEQVDELLGNEEQVEIEFEFDSGFAEELSLENIQNWTDLLILNKAHLKLDYKNSLAFCNLQFVRKAKSTISRWNKTVQNF